MLPSQNLIPITLSFPFRGIDTNTPSTMLVDGHSPQMSNVELTKDHILQKRRGYAALASVIDPGETIQRIEEFVGESGIRHSLAFTTKHQWLYDESTDTAQWRDISFSTALTGTDEDFIDFAVGYDNTGKYCMITNGVDKPLWWNGGMETFEQIPIDIPSFVSCKTIAVFQSRLFLGGLVSTGEQSVITYSAAGDFSDWLGSDTGTVLIAESKGEILALRVLGTQLIVYSRNSIISVSYVGGSILYSFTLVTSDITLVSIGGIVSLDAYHILLTDDKFYLFNGTPNLVKISKELEFLLWTTKEKIRPFDVRNFYLKEEKTVYWVMPYSTDSYITLLLRINSDNSFDWIVFTYSDMAYDFSYYTPSRSLTYNCNGLAGISYDDIAAPGIEIPTGYNRQTYESAFNEELFSQVMFSSELNVMHLLDTDKDGGDNASSVWHSPDFTLPQAYQSQAGRWLEIELEMQNNIRLSYSIDKGVTWSIETQINTNNAAWSIQKYYLDVVAETLQFRIKYFGGAQWKLRWLRVWVIPEGAS